MIEQQGRVVAVLPLQACIEVGPADGCNRCASGKGCGAGLFVRLINRKPTRLLIDSTEQLHPGQRVTIGIPENLFLRWVMCLYGLPLAAAFAVAIPVQLLSGYFTLSTGQTDLLVLVASLSGFIAVLLIMKRRFASGLSESSLFLLAKHSSPVPADCTAAN